MSNKEKVFSRELQPNIINAALAMGVLAVGAVASTLRKQRQTIEQQRQQIEALKTDELTGLRRREIWFSESVDEIMNNRGSVYGVVFVDLNNLKRINDGRGHDVGDSYLKVVAEVLRKSTKFSDIIGRLGGDEFAILMGYGEKGTVKDLDSATTRLQKIFDDYKEGEPMSCFKDLHPGISIGASLIVVSEGISRDDAGELLTQALKVSDERMYDHKITQNAER